MDIKTKKIIAREILILLSSIIIMFLIIIVFEVVYQIKIESRYSHLTEIQNSLKSEKAIELDKGTIELIKEVNGKFELSKNDKLATILYHREIKKLENHQIQNKEEEFDFSDIVETPPTKEDLQYKDAILNYLFLLDQTQSVQYSIEDLSRVKDRLYGGEGWTSSWVSIYLFILFLIYPIRFAYKTTCWAIKTITSKDVIEISNPKQPLR